MAKEKEVVANDELANAMALLDKKFGTGTTMMTDTVIKTPRMRTGSLGLDIITGGGYGKGRMVECYAPESSGKTTLAIHGMVEAQKSGGTVAVIDVEHAFDKSYAENLGLDMSKVIFSQPSSGEQALEIADTLIKTGKIAFMLIDSIAALTPQAELDGEMGDSKMGLHARLMGQACRKLTSVVGKTETVLFWTNQIREKIGVMFGSPETTPGGNAMKFYASIRLDMRKYKGKEVDGERKTSSVKVKTVKNKLAPPFQVCAFDIIFGEGIDTIGEIIEWGVAAGLIKKSGSWFSYGDIKLGQGDSGVRKLLEDNPDLVEELLKQIRTAYGI
jgi:recombination protein RecA